MTRNIFLTQESIALVLLTKEDAPDLQRWMNDPTVNRFLGRGALPLYLSHEEDWIDSLSKRTDHLTLGIWHTPDQQLIGSMGLHQIDQLNQTAELGVVIGEAKYWSQGLGTKTISLLCQHGFTRLNLRHITLRVLGNNPRGQTCYKRLGFTCTGTVPKHVFKEGAWHDEVHMLLTEGSFNRK